jgi:CHAT domain-containing protein
MSTEEIRRAEAWLEQAIYLSDLPQNRAANLDRVIELLHLAAAGFRTDPRYSEEWAVTQYELGLTHVGRINGDRRANLDIAITHYRNSATVFTLEKHADRFAMVQQNLGSAFSDLVDLDPLDPGHSLNAIEAHRAALNAHRYRRNPVDWASAANNLAVAYRDALHGPRADQIEEAIQLHEAALGVFTAGAAGIAEALNLRRHDNPHWSDSMVRQAPITRTSLQQGEEHYTRVDFVRDCARTFAHLAISLGARLRGDAAQNIEESINASLMALRLFGELGDTRDQARVANNLGHELGLRVLGTSFDNLQRSVQHYRAALALHRKSSSPFEIAQTEQNLGATLLRIAERFPERSAQERNAETEEAIHQLKSSLHIRTRERYPFHWAMTCSMLARAHVHRMDGDAETNLEEAIRLFDEALGVRELRSGSPMKWLELKVNQGEASFRRVRGDHRTNVETASQCYRIAAEGFEAGGLVEPAVRARTGLADALIVLDRKAEALEVLRSTVAQIESARAAADWTHSRRQWALQLSTVIDRLVALSWEESPAQALEWSEFGRGRALADIQIGRRRPPSAVSDARFHEYLQLQELQIDLERRLAAADNAEAVRMPLLARIGDARTQSQRLEREFRASDPAWSPSVRPLELPELLDTASACEVPILVVRVNDDATYAWLLRPHQPLAAKRFEGPSRERIRRMLIGTEEDRESSWIGSYGMAQAGETTSGAFDSWLGTMKHLLGELWTELVAGLHELVTEGSHDTGQVIVIPSQALGLLPLHAAWRIVDDDVRYWCDDYAVSYAPSISALRAAMRPPRIDIASPKLLTIANPTADLSWAYLEAVRVAERFSGEHTILSHPQNVGAFAEASKAAVVAELARGPHIIHFSCHGTWDVEDPWSRAGFLLADALDGMPNLTLRDLSGLDLSTCRLAILSACETGMSDASDPADEFVGLPATLIACGASTVVGSLWSISDVSTALMITKAFSTMDPREPIDVLARLHEAQRWIRNARAEELSAAMKELGVKHASAGFDGRDEHPYAHPFWWAALTCVGMPR